MKKKNIEKIEKNDDEFVVIMFIIADDILLIHKIISFIF